MWPREIVVQACSNSPDLASNLGQNVTIGASVVPKGYSKRTLHSLANAALMDYRHLELVQIHERLQKANHAFAQRTPSHRSFRMHLSLCRIAVTETPKHQQTPFLLMGIVVLNPSNRAPSAPRRAW